MILRYLTTISYPSRLANRLQVIKMSEAFSRALADYELAVGEMPRPELVLKEYGIQQSIAVKEIGEAGSILWPRSFWQALKCRTYIAASPAGTIWYVRDVLLAYVLTFISRSFRNSFYFENHSLGKF